MLGPLSLVAVLPLVTVQPLSAQTFHDSGMVNAGGRAVIDRIVQQGAVEQARSSDTDRPNESGFEPEDILARFGQRPYIGQMILEVQSPGLAPITAYGEGSAVLEPTGDGLADLRLEGRVPGEQTSMQMVVTGRYDETGWSSGSDDERIRLAPDGSIEGFTRQAAGEVRFRGHATESTFSLTTEVHHRTDQQGVPAGSVSKVRYLLQRKSVSQSQEGTDCRMELRPIGNSAGASMSLAPEATSSRQGERIWRVGLGGVRRDEDRRGRGDHC